jgi:hypothetical protein
MKVLPLGAVVVLALALRVVVGEVRDGRGGERGPLMLPPPPPPFGPAPGGGRRFAGEGISFRGIGGIVSGVGFVDVLLLAESCRGWIGVTAREGFEADKLHHGMIPASGNYALWVDDADQFQRQSCCRCLAENSSRLSWTPGC